MAGKAREVVEGVPLHVFQQGLHEQQCFFEDQDYRRYLEWMAKYSKDAGCAIHAYVLMPTHSRILLTPYERQSVSRLMMYLGRRYAHHANRAQGRSGSLFEKSFRSAMLTDPEDVLACHWYIERNPVRAMLVDRPREYPWSSYHANAYAESNGILTPHAAYEELGANAAERAAAYVERSHLELDPGHESTGLFLPRPT